MMTVKILTAAVIAMLLAACASTSSMRLATPEDPFAMPIDEFLQEQQIVLNDLEQGQPRELDEYEWKRLNRITGNITELVGDARKVEDIDLETRNTLFDLRNQLVAMLVGGSAQEVVCHQVRLTGTRLGSNRRICVSRMELEQSRFQAQYALEFLNASPSGQGQGMDPMGVTDPRLSEPSNR